MGEDKEQVKTSPLCVTLCPGVFVAIFTAVPHDNEFPPGDNETEEFEGFPKRFEQLFPFKQTFYFKRDYLSARSR